MGRFLFLGEIGSYCLACDEVVGVDPCYMYWDTLKQRCVLQCPVCRGYNVVRINPATEQLLQRVKRLEQQGRAE